MENINNFTFLITAKSSFLLSDGELNMMFFPFFPFLTFSMGVEDLAVCDLLYGRQFKVKNKINLPEKKHN